MSTNMIFRRTTYTIYIYIYGTLAAGRRPSSCTRNADLLLRMLVFLMVLVIIKQVSYLRKPEFSPVPAATPKVF